MSPNNLVNNREYGFRHRSTSDLLTYVTKILSFVIDCYAESEVVALDISKAYNHVW